ncbi:VOC family protein [Catellatospora methionotrophica]|uniref:VOC family protein n=1 Tax=Catellatospora methionotrophica TaxID=121620 RepID=UPI001EF3CD08|nr:VOC family protein [Catellatospora methionotrophica]
MIATLRYRDAVAAIRFLRDAFGFRELLVVPGADETVAHAELTHGSGMVMVSSITDGGDGRTPFEAGPAWLYVIVDDVQAHYDRAVAGGAEIVSEPKKEEYGGSSYTAADPEGNQWTFGSYRPEGW